MAKDVKKKLKRDEFDIDDELDFGDFNFEQISGEINSPDSKDRKPTTEVFKGVISGVGEEVIDSKFIRKTAEEFLPKEYSSIFSAADKVGTGVTKLYDQSIREIKPQLNILARKIDKLVPQEEGVLRKLADKFVDVTGGQERKFYDDNEAARLENSIQSTIAGVFEANQETEIKLRARENVEASVRETVGKKRFETEINLLSGIHDNLSRLSSYNDNITQAYQKKSLELQLRSYFVQKELLTYTRRYQETSSEQFKGIVINTALPEFTKIQKSEVMREEMQKKLAQQVSRKLFGDGDWIDNTLDKLSSYVKEKTAEFKEGIEMSTGLADEALATKENYTEGDIPTESPFRTAGKIIGGEATGFVRDKLAPKAKSAIESKAPWVDKLGKKLHGVILNPFESIDKIKNSEAMEEGMYSNNVLKSMAYTTVHDLISTITTSDIKDNINVKKPLASDTLTIGNQTDSKMLVSVTEIIPGYLARIYRELQSTRSGDNAPMVVFDKINGVFKTEQRLDKDIRQTLKTAIKNKSYANQKESENFTKDLLGDNQSPEDAKAFKKLFLSFYKEYDGDNSPNAILKSKSFRELSDDQKTKVKTKFEEKFDPSVNPNSDGDKNKLMAGLSNMRKRAPNVQELINKMLEAGQQDTLIKLGIVEVDDNGRYRLVKNKYADFLTQMEMSEDDKADSDINVKTNIKPFNTKNALTAIKNTATYSWKYKQGLGDGSSDTRIGPMAQDVKKTMGESVAPEGKKIDLVSMNGITMSAIKQLDAKIESSLKPAVDQNKQETPIKSQVETKSRDEKLEELLKAISDNTGKSLGKLDDLAKITVLQTKNLNADKSFARTLNKTAVTSTRILKDITVGTGKLGFKLSTAMISKGTKGLVKGLGTYYDNRKKVDETLRMGGSLAASAVRGIGSLAKSGVEGTLDLAGKYVKGIYKEVNSILIGTDIYVKGELTPRMTKQKIESGVYFDKKSGKPIRKFEDIKSDVVDKSGNIVLQASDIAKGLVDMRGTPIKAMFRASISALKGLGGFASSLTGGILGTAWKAGKKAFDGSMFDGLGGGKSYKVLVDIRNILKKNSGYRRLKNETEETNGQTEKTDSSFSAIGQKAENILNKSKLGRRILTAKDKLTEKMGIKKPTITDQKPVTETKDVQKKEQNNKIPVKKDKGSREERLARLKSRLDQRANIKTQSKQDKISLDKNTESVKTEKATDTKPTIKSQNKQTPIDRLKIPVKKDKGTIDERKARIAARREKSSFNDKDGSGRRDGSWMDKLDKSKEESTSIKSKKSKDPLGPDMTVKYKEGGLLSGLLGKLSTLLSGTTTLISGAMSLFGSLGKGIFGVAKHIPGLAGSAIKALPAIARALPAAITVLSSGIFGGVFGGIAAAGSMALGAAMTPPGLALLAAAGAAYGLYRGYKYFTKNNLTKYELYRVYQYGFNNSSEHSQHHHKLMELEGLMLDGNISVSGGEPKINRNLKWDDIAGIFGVNPEDKEQNEKLKDWFNNRFKFFFINHLRVLLKINPKARLDQLDKLKPEELKRYLELSSFEDGPHDYKVSPVKDVNELSDNRALIKIELKNLLVKISSQIKVDTPKTEDETKKTKETKPSLIPKTEDKELGKDNQLKKKDNSVTKTDAEDGKAPPSAGIVDSKSIVGGVKSPPLANGPMRDGSTGMQFISFKPGVDIDNLHPDVKKNLLAMAQEYGEITGKKISLNDAFRSYEKQAEIHRKSPEISAPPGRSLHEFGLALDADRGILGELDKMGLMKKYGFTRPVGSEPWHFEPAGIQLALQESKSNPATASKLVEYGVGRGGGGFGTLNQTGAKGRNYDMAKALLDATASGTINNQLTEEDVNIAGKAMGKTPSAEPGATSAGKTVNTYDALGNVTGTTTEEQPAKTGSKSVLPDDNAYDAMGNFTGTHSETSIKAAKAPTQDILRKTGGNTYDAMGNVTGSEDGKLPASATGNTAKGETGDIASIIEKAAVKAGVDPKTLKTFATIESNMNPNAKNPNSSASGLFQFTKDTWMEQLRKHGKKYNLGSDASPLDPTASSLLAGEYVKNSLSTLKNVKSDPDDLDLYLAHFLGPAGATKFLSAHPNVPGSQLFPAAASSNKEIFFDGRRPRTLGEIYELFKKKVAKAGGMAKGALTAKAGSGPTSTSGSPATSTTSTASQNPAANSSGIQNANYQQDVPQKKSITAFQQAPDLQATSKPAVDTGKNTGMDLNTVNNNLGESLNVQKQMLDVLSKIHGLMSNRSGSGDKAAPETQAPVSSMPNAAKKESLPNPALDLRRRTT